jgi:hypothetical protein
VIFSLLLHEDDAEAAAAAMFKYACTFGVVTLCAGSFCKRSVQSLPTAAPPTEAVSDIKSTKTRDLE